MPKATRVPSHFCSVTRERGLGVGGNANSVKGQRVHLKVGVLETDRDSGRRRSAVPRTGMGVDKAVELTKLILQHQSEGAPQLR